MCLAITQEVKESLRNLDNSFFTFGELCDMNSTWEGTLVDGQNRKAAILELAKADGIARKEFPMVIRIVWIDRKEEDWDWEIRV